MAEEYDPFADMENSQETEQTNENAADELQSAAETANAASEPESKVYNYEDLPDAPAQKYERVELDGQTVAIEKAEIEIPRADAEWNKTLNGTGLSKNYGFVIYFDTPNNDREHLSGLKGFKDEKTGLLSKPSLFRAGKNQVSLLFKVYETKMLKSGITQKEFDADYGLKKLMNFLNSKPKAIIETVGIEFQGKTYRKNRVKEFL